MFHVKQGNIKVIKQERDAVLTQLNLKEEIIEKFDRYVEILFEEQKKKNLIGPSTIPFVWTRHILDSAQLFVHLKETDKIILDLGSGAGFPALVLAMMDFEKKYTFYLVESDGKKASFLNKIIENCDLKAKVLNERIEKINPFSADVVTARALASLDKLIKYTKPFITNQTRCFFMKGQKADEEIKVALKKYHFQYEKINSITNQESAILLLSEVENK